MMHTSFAVWGIVIVVLLAGTWMVLKTIRRLRRSDHVDELKVHGDVATPPSAIEHRVLMFLMTQQTDAVLAAIGRTIEEERQKLGGIVRNPSIGAAVGVGCSDAPPARPPRSVFDHVLSMLRQGETEAAIARALHVPEAEVAMVRRLHAA